MKISPHRALLTGFGVLGISIAVAGAAPFGEVVAARGLAGRTAGNLRPVAQSEEELAKAGEEASAKICGVECHGIDRLDEGRRSAREWNDVVADMISRGARGTDDQFALVRQYLKRYYGVVLVNSAPAEELSAVLGFTAKDAKAVVDYRMAHGKFANAVALAKVPGIDTSKIEEQPGALRFN